MEEQANIPRVHVSVDVIWNLGEPRKAVSGIGYALGKEHIGKRVVRTMPVNQENWSFTAHPKESTLETFDCASILLTGWSSEEASFVFVYEDNDEEKRILDPRYCRDENWMLLEDYKEWLANNALEQFEQVMMPPISEEGQEFRKTRRFDLSDYFLTALLQASINK